MGNYLYNGIELPALPDWDRETYPFAIIYYGVVQNLPIVRSYVLKIGTAPQYQYDNDGDWAYGILSEYHYILKEGEWVSKTPSSNVDWISTVGSDFTLWTSMDILYEDGTVGNAASEPVPVSTYTPNPAAMVNGWLMGQAVRRMRRS